MTTRGNIAPLNAQIEANRSKAQSFYAAQKTHFLKVLKQKEAQVSTEFIANRFEEIIRYIYKEWENVSKMVEQAIINNAGKPKAINTTFSTANGSVLLTIPAAKNEAEAKQQVKQFAGPIYEQFVVEMLNNLVQDAANAGNKMLEGMVDSIIGGFVQTGNIVRGSSAHGGRKAGTQILSDISFGLNMDILQENKYRTTDLGGVATNPELGLNFSLEDVTEPQVLNNDILQKYLDADVFGFSLKNYLLESSDSYTGAIGIATEINETFRESGRRTWNAAYAQATANLIVSKYLISVLGPTNIGVIEKTAFTWMPDFIKNWQFQISVYSNKLAKNNEAYHPYVNSSNIHLVKLISSNTMKWQLTELKNGTQYYKIRVSAKSNKN